MARRHLDRRRIRRLLGGFRVREATTPSEACAALEEDRVDCVVLDLDLPDPSDTESRSLLGKLTEHVPVIALTDDDESALERLCRCAQDSFLKKSLSGELLGRAIRYAIERKEAERSLELTRRLLERSRRMEVVGQLVGSVAHDFNNILTVIVGHCTLLRLQLEAGSREAASVEEIELASERAVRLVRRLLAYGRPHETSPQVTELNTLLSGMEEMIRRLIPEAIEIRIVLSDDPCYVHADSTDIEQIVMNLAINARDAMPDGGALHIETDTAFLDGELEHGSATRDPYVRLTVRDSGHGMDAQTREHIFEPFFSTKEEEKGTGLGLATVHEIVKQARGHIAVTTSPGRGARFEVYLPLLASGRSGEGGSRSL